MRQVECCLENSAEWNSTWKRSLGVTVRSLWLANKHFNSTAFSILVGKLENLTSMIWSLTVHEKLKWLSWAADAETISTSFEPQLGSWHSSLSCWEGGGCFLSAEAENNFYFVTQSVCYGSVLHVGILGCVVVKLAGLSKVSLQCFYLPDSLTLFLLFFLPLPVYSA